MRKVERLLKHLLVGFMRSPSGPLAEIVRRLRASTKRAAQVARLRGITSEAPLILQIETTNVCNAACAFCAYPSMQRKKGVMSMALFEKLVCDYAAMGGGPVSLTPVVGDALLDPHLIDRLRVLAAEPRVNQVTMTTNAIALDRYRDEDVRLLLETLDCIQISLGGLDAATYRAMYGVDRLSRVLSSLERLLTLDGQTSHPAQITCAFRTNDWRFELRFQQQLDAYRERGAFVSHIWTYANYSGVIKNDREPKLDVLESPDEKNQTCVYPCVHLAVCWDGAITVCGCADFEGSGLRIGNAEAESIAEAWRGEKRERLLSAFADGRLPPICQRCSAYQPDTIFGGPIFQGLAPHEPLPLAYLQRFWGG